jgi:hypothetical protein
VSLAVAQQMLARLEADAGGALAAWAQTWATAVPACTLGWRRPQRAQDWPYVALVPVADARDLVRGRTLEAGVALACGVRLASQERPAAEGVEAVEALADAALGLLAAPLRYAAAGGCALTATQARRVMAEFSHPSYELELRIDLAGPPARGLA